MKIRLLFLLTAMLATLIGFSQNINFTDESDGKINKIQYKVLAGNQLSIFKTRISTKVFASKALKKYLLDSRKTSDVLLMRVLKKIGDDSTTGSAEKILVYTVERNNGTIVQGDFVVTDRNDIDKIMKAME
jgi:hypothetical protein